MAEHAPGNQGHRSLLRNLGEFVGHVAAGIKSDPGGTAALPPAAADHAAAAPARAVKREVRERIETTEQGTVILRRTTIDEVEVLPVPGEAHPAEASTPAPAPPQM